MVKKVLANLILTILVILSFVNKVFAIEAKDVDLTSGDAYYKLWNDTFITYIDNYSGDINNVSINDLKGKNGSSTIFLFSRLRNGNYTYDDLVKDLENEGNATTLHDTYPILILLPKTAKSFESHDLLKTDDEKGKLFSGGPYSKYKSYKNGFYYKDKAVTKDEVNKILKDYQTKATALEKRIDALKEYSIKDLYPKAVYACLTNAESCAAGTVDAVLYTIDIEQPFSPYGLNYATLKKTSLLTLKAEKTINILPDWDTDTIYLMDENRKTIQKISLSDLKQALWDKQ